MRLRNYAMMALAVTGAMMLTHVEADQARRLRRRQEETAGHRRLSRPLI